MPRIPPKRTAKTTQRVQRLPINQMTSGEVRSWIVETREKLLRKMQRERTYLDRRVARGAQTPTDEAYEADQLLEADLLALLDEMEQSLEVRGYYAT
jgi:hypothetical protein